MTVPASLSRESQGGLPDDDDRFGALSLTLLLGAAGASAAPIYILGGLGDLPGGVDSSRAHGIKDAGQVVGWSEASTGGRAFPWDEINGLRGSFPVLLADHEAHHDLVAQRLGESRDRQGHGIHRVGGVLDPVDDGEKILAAVGADRRLRQVREDDRPQRVGRQAGGDVPGDRVAHAVETLSGDIGPRVGLGGSRGDPASGSTSRSPTVTWARRGARASTTPRP